jgi:uncharacterized protein YyaL (SSP411 family)
LIQEKSPYLLQHAHNPVDWYPWGEDAFNKAKSEDKPIFLSIGYSTCHWCHVMAHESFEDTGIAALLNRSFVSIKVDKEERPDLDSVYMAFCQAFTGSGGWPTSIFMTPDQKPFFAGTYFPKTSRGGLIGFQELLSLIQEKWKSNRPELIQSGEKIMALLKIPESGGGAINASLIRDAVAQFRQSFDPDYGGFGQAPKFPAPHNLLFLMDYYEKSGDPEVLEMVEVTLRQMYRGGLFDHIGYGFSRYSTDRFFLVPHFEKMLYDNALLILSYATAYYVTKNPFYREVAEKTAEYILRKMTGSDGEFYSAQDADSDGIEGKYYVFTPEEIVHVLGKDVGTHFNHVYGITEQGNFNGKSIPNLLHSGTTDTRLVSCLPKLRTYRQERAALHLDDKVLSAWNSLMIAAFSLLYRVSHNEAYLRAAEKAEAFLAKHLCENETLFVSFRDGSRGGHGFLGDYAFYVFALTALYEASLDSRFLEKAQRFCNRTIADFHDTQNGGFTLSGKENERLILAPKETYDGAIPSGNSVMAYNLVKLYALTDDKKYGSLLEKQLAFLSTCAKQYPAGYSFSLLALSRYLNPPKHVTAVLKREADRVQLKNRFGLDTDLSILAHPTPEYPLLHDKMTFYVCKNHSCLPPTNEIPEKNRLL